jgi:hypothetical protein
MAANTSSWPPGKEGEIKTWRPGSSRGRKGKTEYYKYTNGQWMLTTDRDEKKAKDDYLDQNNGSLSYNVLGSPGIGAASLRYPKDAAMASNSDYVLFEFYKYVPPFQNINKGATKDRSKPLATYNQSAADAALYKKSDVKAVILYMPEDISTGYKANWSGKAFSNIGAAALSMAGSGDFGQGLQNGLNLVGTSADQLLPNAGNKIINEVVGKITGEQLSQNDIFGSTRGVILNPNVELLFAGIDLRNFSLSYKLVPRNDEEAGAIKEIINSFRKAMLPSFSDGTELALVGGNNIANNFIKVPNVCRVSFMRGGTLNTDVPQYKMCAITQVDINYTPDGTYATYEDGKMVAIEMSLSFQETKLIFAEEVEKY